MSNYFIDADTRIGTISGTLLVLLVNINTGEFLKTVIMAATAAAVSFSVSLFCKYILKRISRKK
ncbi:hypothetical protein BH11BAC4_BH11BAC4_06700 [soil metagenome]